MKKLDLNSLNKRQIFGLTEDKKAFLTKEERDAIEVVKHFMNSEATEVQVSDVEYEKIQSAFKKISTVDREIIIGELVKYPGHESWYIRNVKTGKLEGRVQNVDDRVPE